MAKSRARHARYQHDRAQHIVRTLALDEVRGAFNDYRRAGYALGITALDVLWCPALLLQHQPEAALEVIEQGLATAGHNSERLFEAELYRLKARALLARGAADARTEAQPCSTKL